MYKKTNTENINNHNFFIDIPLSIFILSLMSISLTVLYSMAGADVVASQAIRFGIGIVSMLFVLLISKNIIRFFAPFFYVLTMILIIAVYFYGTSINNSQRWLNIGITQIQPSELAKISIPLMLSYYFYSRELPPKWKDILISLAIIMVPTIFVLNQPDLGTAILVASSGIVLLFLSGISWRLIFAAFILIAIVSPIYWLNGMEEYQKKRVLIALNPDMDPIGDGYNIIQSMIAIGSGGMHGKGFFKGMQSLEFLPENTTDFIFAALSEEIGFVGVSLLFILYFLIIFRCFWLCLKMTDNFSRLLSGTLTFTFFLYFFINVGMVSGILPVVGLPLPLISFGGTSIMTLMISFGLIMNLYASRNVVKKATIGL